MVRRERGSSRTRYVKYKTLKQGNVHYAEDKGEMRHGYVRRHKIRHLAIRYLATEGILKMRLFSLKDSSVKEAEHKMTEPLLNCECYIR